jgi:thiamine-monophosphate kinase
MKKTVSLRRIGELGLIREIRRWVPSVRPSILGIGDDAAAVPYDRRRDLLLAVDCLVENVDFKMRDAAPEAVGRKALAINLSDMAAMGGRPLYALVSLGLPPRMSVAYVRRFYRGLTRLARAWRVAVVGGDISRSDNFFASVTVAGLAEKGRIPRRGGARTGDWIFVTGRLGGSILGKHFTFTPRIAEARFLLSRFAPHAMIDVSDGLIQDLNHVLAESGKGAVLYLDSVPVSSAARSAPATRRGRTPLEAALSDGEDFELLFTVSPSDGRKILRLPRGLAGTPVTRIGSITRGKGLWLDTGRGQISVDKMRKKWKGYAHF